MAWHVVEPSTGLVWGWHLDAICEHLEAVTAGKILNLLITIPPGCTKSLLVGVFWPAWTWTRCPWKSWLCAANEADLTLRDAVACRRLIESDWYRQRWGQVFSLTSDQNVKGWYENDKRGFRTSTTVGSSVTGKKGSCLILDDPDDATKVHSEAERERVYNWWSRAFFNRVNDHRTGQRVVIGQRVHNKDLIGRIIEAGGFEHLCIPEEFEADRKYVTSIGWTDPREEPGELLRPERFGDEQIAEAKGRLGLPGYLAQHQQRPTKAGACEWPDEYFAPAIWFDDYPSDIEYTVIALDPSKGKSAKHGDYSAIVRVSRCGSGLLWCEADLQRRPTSQIVADMLELGRTLRPDIVGIETNQFQELLADDIAEQSAKTGVMLPIVNIDNRVNKDVRIRRLGPYLARRKLRFRANSPGTALLVEQMQEFPEGSHDDGPDALEMAIRLMEEFIGVILGERNAETMYRAG